VTALVTRWRRTCPGAPLTSQRITSTRKRIAPAALRLALIPTNPTAQSERRRSPNQIGAEHHVQPMPSGPGRSETTLVSGLLPWVGLRGQACAGLPHGFSFRGDVVGVVDEAIERGVGDGRVAERFRGRLDSRRPCIRRSSALQPFTSAAPARPQRASSRTRKNASVAS